MTASLIVRDPHRARAAHLLRRTTLTVDPDRIDELAGVSWADAVAAVLDEAAVPGGAAVPDGADGAEGSRRAAGDELPDHGGDWAEVASWWVRAMVERRSPGLRDRMAWFWHGLLTTNADKVSSLPLLAEQVRLLRVHALGDYRTLLHAIVTSGAMLDYLDASHSMATNPNENLARELMELFTIGRDAYTEDDVRAAARALAGWVVDDSGVRWRRDHAFVAPLLFRGVQDRWDTTRIVDHLCDAPETAVRVSSRLWLQLVGTVLEPPAAVELGRWWQGHDLAIVPLIERILLHPTAESARGNRVRGGLEWYVAFRSVTGRDAAGDDPWLLDNLGQMPYRPPSVGGWPDGARWLSASSLLARASLAFNVTTEALDGGRSGTPADILDRCGLHEVSAATLDALDAVRATDDLSPEAAHHTRWRLALSTPEFHLS